VNKMVIDNRTDITDIEALRYVTEVVKVGRVSRNGTQYSYIVAFNNGITVSSYMNKKSDRFVITGAKHDKD